MEEEHGIFVACPYPLLRSQVEKVEEKAEELGESEEDVLLTALKKGLDDF